ncbi:MAG: hypothetical protein ACK56F_32320, partial [bacterium]
SLSYENKSDTTDRFQAPACGSSRKLYNGDSHFRPPKAAETVTKLRQGDAHCTRNLKCDFLQNDGTDR